MIKLHYNEIEADNHFVNIKGFIQNRIRTILASGIRYQKRTYRLTGMYSDYLRSLLNDIELKKLITAKPDTFEALISDLQRDLPEFLDAATPNHHTLYNIFISHCYEPSGKFKKLEFIKQVDVDTCPYCNRNYIYYLSKTNEVKPQIDHFFPKSKYPFLGMSFYNLIPSCQTCNGFGAKEEKDPLQYGIRNPYLLQFSDFDFSYEVLSISILDALINKESIELQMPNNIAGNMKVFKLKELYQQHTDHIIELIIKSKVKYSETYRNYLKTYRDSGLQISDNDIDRMILGNYATETDVHKRPLAKMYQNIGRQLGLIVKDIST